MIRMNKLIAAVVAAMMIMVCVVTVLPSQSEALPVTGWHSENPLPGNRTFAASAQVGSTIYLMGGKNNTTSTAMTTNVLSYNLTTGSYVRLANMLVGVGITGAASDGKEIFIVGGYVPGAIYKNTLQIYNISTNTWTLGPVLPVGGAGTSAAVIGDKLYVVGGYNSTGGATNKTQIFNIHDRTWSAGPALPAARYGGSLVAYGGALYYFGGFLSGGQNTSYKWLTTGSWFPIAAMPEARGFTNAVVGADGQLYIAGGSNADSFTNSHDNLFYYTPDSNSWGRGPNLTRAVSMLAMAATDEGRVFVLGGNNATSAFPTVYSLRIATIIVALTPSGSIGTGRSFQVNLTVDFAFRSPDTIYADFYLVSDSGGSYAYTTGATYNSLTLGKEIQVPITAPEGRYQVLIKNIQLVKTGSSTFYIADRSVAISVVSVPTLQAQVDALKAEVITLQSQILLVSENIILLQANMSAQQVQMTTAQSALDEAQTQLAALKAQMTATQSEIALISSGFDRQISGLNAEQNASGAQLALLQNQITALQAMLNTSQAQLTQASSDLSGVKSTVNGRADGIMGLLTIVLALVMIGMAVLLIVLTVRKKKGV
jgi:N-acetylneuraminic acid mutarotase